MQQRGRPRPVPIAVPAEDDAHFKLSEQGVLEAGGAIVSKQCCIIQRNSGDQRLPAAGGKRADCTPHGGLPAAAGGGSSPGLGASSGSNNGTPGGTSSSSCSSSVATTPLSGASSSSAGGNPAASTAAAAAAAPSGSISSGSGVRLEDLQDLGIIGRGSGGVVKQVLHRPSGQMYGLKVIHADLTSQQLRRQVIAEVQALEAARHPHVVSYVGSFFSGGAITILMEWMDGGSLADVLARVRVVPPAYLPELARQMMAGLAHLHGTARICHRDIKPANLLLSRCTTTPPAASSDAGAAAAAAAAAPRGCLKISDFGVSSQLSGSMSQCVTWVGTVTYMSPERIRGDAYGTNTDVWSAGLVLLEAALGRFPYPPRSEGSGGGGAAAGASGGGGPGKMGFWELLEYIVVEPAPRPPPGAFPPEFCDFVAACLQKDAARRPSAAAMLAHPFIANGPAANLGDLLAPQQQQQRPTQQQQQQQQQQRPAPQQQQQRPTQQQQQQRPTPQQQQQQRRPTPQQQQQQRPTQQQQQQRPTQRPLGGSTAEAVGSGVTSSAQEQAVAGSGGAGQVVAVGMQAAAVAPVSSAARCGSSQLGLPVGPLGRPAGAAAAGATSGAGARVAMAGASSSCGVVLAQQLAPSARGVQPVPGVRPPPPAAAPQQQQLRLQQQSRPAAAGQQQQQQWPPPQHAPGPAGQLHQARLPGVVVMAGKQLPSQPPQQQQQQQPCWTATTGQLTAASSPLTAGLKPSPQRRLQQAPPPA